MKSFIIYLSGVATPIVIIIAIVAKLSFQQWRDERRYKRAWDKFGAEFDNLSPLILSIYRELWWPEEPDKYQHLPDDRSRYFKMRWNYGFTTEV